MNKILFYEYFVKNVAAFLHFPNSLPETNEKRVKLIALTNEVSKHYTLHSLMWFSPMELKSYIKGNKLIKRVENLEQDPTQLSLLFKCLHLNNEELYRAWLLFSLGLFTWNELQCREIEGICVIQVMRLEDTRF